MNENVRVVEIGGVKMEIDLRSAKVVESFRVGDSVKVLVKSYGESFKSHPGVIIGFDEFKNLPTIVVMYLEMGSYSGDGIKFAYINSTSEVELCAAAPDDLHYDKSATLNAMDRAISTKERELEDAKLKKQYFITMIGKHFGVFVSVGS